MEAASRTQEFVAINGGQPVTDELTRLREEVARLEMELEAERARSASFYAQLTVATRQLDAASEPPSRGGFLGRRAR
jgi:hypothetical protein